MFGQECQHKIKFHNYSFIIFSFIIFSDHIVLVFKLYQTILNHNTTHTYRPRDVCAGTNTYMCAYIDTYIESHAWLKHIQILMFVYKHACIHTYIIHPFQPRNKQNFRIKSFHNIQIYIFPEF